MFHVDSMKIRTRFLVWSLSIFFIAELKRICTQYHERVYICEGQKWDLEREVRKRDYEVLLSKRKQITVHK